MPDLSTPNWLHNILFEAQTGDTLIARVERFLQLLHNEMAHGFGQTNPEVMTKALSDRSDAVAAALDGDYAPINPPADPAVSGFDESNPSNPPPAPIA